MIFAIVLTLCSFASCNDYVVDVADSATDAQTNLVSENASLKQVWNITTTNKPLGDWLQARNIDEDPRFLELYEFNVRRMESKQ